MLVWVFYLLLIRAIQNETVSKDGYQLFEHRPLQLLFSRGAFGLFHALITRLCLAHFKPGKYWVHCFHLHSFEHHSLKILCKLKSSFQSYVKQAIRVSRMVRIVLAVTNLRFPSLFKADWKLLTGIGPPRQLLFSRLPVQLLDPGIPAASSLARDRNLTLSLQGESFQHHPTKPDLFIKTSAILLKGFLSWFPKVLCSAGQSLWGYLTVFSLFQRFSWGLRGSVYLCSSSVMS